MNRPLKFKVYIPAENKIYLCDSIGWNDALQCMEVTVKNPNWNFDEMMGAVQNGFKYEEFPVFSYTEKEHDIKILQYTGMKDKNDNEIYEYDVIRIGNNYWRVGWDKSGKWCLFDLIEKYKIVDIWPVYKKIDNVVGNIHSDADIFIAK